MAARAAGEESDRRGAGERAAETAKHATIRSLFEVKLLPLIAAADLPIPHFNARVRTAERTLEVDLLWPEHQFIVEADSRRQESAPRRRPRGPRRHVA